MLKTFTLFNKSLYDLKSEKTLICTLNAHCYNLTKNDSFYHEALVNSTVLLPDGVSVKWATKWLTGQKIKKIAGADLFFYEMKRLQQFGGKCFFLGSSNDTLLKIKERLNSEYPNIKVGFYSPPFKPQFTKEDNALMVDKVNAFQPDALLIGMTAPKQEKWAYRNYNQLQADHICCIGAVFDFYAGTITRAPKWMISLGLEWLYRLIKEPKRMWRRYLIGNCKFIWFMVKEKIGQ